MKKNHFAFIHDGNLTEEHIFCLTFVERINLLVTALFHKSIRVTLVPQEKWEKYCGVKN